MRLAEARKKWDCLRADVRETPGIQVVPRCLSQLLPCLAAWKKTGWLMFAALVWGQVVRADDAEAWRDGSRARSSRYWSKSAWTATTKAIRRGSSTLGKYTQPEGLIESIDVWERMARRVRNGEMPPADSEPLTDDERAAVLGWIDSAPRDERCRQLASDESQKLVSRACDEPPPHAVRVQQHDPRPDRGGLRVDRRPAE
jgi:hypothetical protein